MNVFVVYSKIYETKQSVCVCVDVSLTSDIFAEFQS